VEGAVNDDARIARVIGRPDAYEKIGGGYSEQRRADARIARCILEALGSARTVLNVGAGSGSYEPSDRVVVAVEPSPVMLAQRPADAGPATRAVAEQLPIRSQSFDAALAILTVHHWSNRQAGYEELRRVASRRVVLTFDPQVHNQLWLFHEYLPEVARFEEQRAPSIEEVANGIGATRVEAIPIPHDCSDGFTVAHWRHPHAYLDPNIRRAHSGLAQADPAIIERGLARLREDLKTGRWHANHADLLDRTELDVGIRLVVAEVP
jgi:hypothetical protein